MRRRSQLALSLVMSAVVSACAVGGEENRQNGPGTQIPDPVAGQGGTGGTFNPGNGGMPGSGATYGSGASSSLSGSGGTAGDAGSAGAGGDPGPPPPPECVDDLKRCEHEFVFPDGGESGVVLQGDFTPTGWTTGGVPMVRQGGSWRATVAIPYDKPVTYKYLVTTSGPNGPQSKYIEDPDPSVAKVDDGFGGKNSQLAPTTCDVWTCDPEPVLGYDWRDAVLYFVFVDRFVDGDKSNNKPIGVEAAADFQGGDWKGLLTKINDSYFNDLGVNALWLTVPFDNTSDKGGGSDGHNYSAYHGYWGGDLDKPEEHFGTMDDLKAVVDAAHAKGLKVLFDYAMNHVHQSSPVYAQHKGWFWPNDNGKGGNCVCGEGCSWDDTNEAKKCWFTSYLPDFNFTNAEARKYSIDNALSWIKNTNVDGLRLDAIKHIEPQWVLDLRARVTAEIEPTSKQHFYMVGETYTGDQGVIKQSVNPSTMLDGQFDFPGRMAIAEKLLMRKGSMKDLEGFLAANESVYGANALMSTFIGNHDIPRAIHLAQDTPVWDNQWTDGKDRSWQNQPGLPTSNSAFERMAAAFTLILTSRGVPLIYYGDEVGMAGGGDPDNRRMMQWSGYSSGQQLLNDRIKKLTSIRAAHPALRRGTRSAVSTTDDVLAYKMSTSDDTVYVVINRSDSARTASNLPASLTDLVTGQAVSGPTVNVPARGAMVLVTK